ncbi:MAG: Mrp/NBP35 family ATP-binding protein [Roseitalea sp.]|nr:Mrp/NBP35 family ATP-binding protein [Roseitalea sp.]MBO6952841.1 Mrp/NBP35 family ATP-binding protein [Rhizobiaceae bacterium]MBO6593188.1 Mrp/NBP35 family ATP-binding protein [Roseitalea sp.]MBO6600822.1 Mrp/NBP35 family ATP-binding protein [Roseitalea sp.]MBO6612503.1 Mrp/NBP35 family ATP-binding protein [Roseitalea sp.]
MAQAPSQDIVTETLRKIMLPDGRDLVGAGMVSDIFIADGKVFFSLTCDAADAERLEPVREAAQAAVTALSGVKAAMVALTAEKKGGQSGPEPQARNVPPPPPSAGRRPVTDRAKPGVPGVKHIIAVASGKGGVGKSTTAINLALGLAACGLKTGILDADIYGPSLPRLLGLKDTKPQQLEGRILKPIEQFGLQAMSIGFLVEEETPMIWRGPMVVSAITQMLREVAWSDLDVLVVDMPPGTGDAQLTMAQNVPLSGAVIVSTPQDLALIDARKGLKMFEKVNVPVLGIIENMSYFVAPDTGARYDIFGHGGARAEAQRLGVPFLGEVPLVMAIRETSDAGRPITAAEPDGPHAAAYTAIAERVSAALSTGAGAKPAPAIVFE